LRDLISSHHLPAPGKDDRPGPPLVEHLQAARKERRCGGHVGVVEVLTRVMDADECHQGIVDYVRQAAEEVALVVCLRSATEAVVLE
jgi:hypothetical protein